MNALKWTATFANPDFFQKQKNRLSTYNTPRYISLASGNDHFLVLPRGIEDHLEQSLDEPKITDKTIRGKTLHATFNGQLRPEQQAAQTALLKTHMGILSARTGFGKTVIAASVIAKLKVKTLVIVNNRELAEQWQNRLTEFLKIDDEPFVELTKTGRKKHKTVIGTYFGSKKRRSKLVDIATFQTLDRVDNLAEFFKDYEAVIIDEVHHLAAVTFDNVIKKLAARYIYGLSATPYRRDGWDPIIFLRAGQIAYKTAKVDEQQLMTTERTLITRVTNLGEINGALLESNSLAENYEAMTQSVDRNDLILNDIRENYQNGRHQLVLTQRKAHIELLKTTLEKEHLPVFELSGRQKPKENQAVVAEIEKQTAPYIIIATGSYIGEGFDVKSIDALLITMPVSWKGTVEQYVGRLNRDLDNKSDLLVYDYVDLFIPMLARMYQKRLKAYRDLHYRVLSDEDRDQGIQILNSQHAKNAFLADLESVNKDNQSVIIGSQQIDETTTAILKRVNTTNLQVVSAPQQRQPNQQAYKQITNQVPKFVTCEETPEVVIISERVVWYRYKDIMRPGNHNLTLRLSSSAIAEQFMKQFSGDISLLD
ncbi:DEAD/DEAH box helicase [Secundilactobacillus paracollinoides]|uniref:DEAD/DEAH box helicase n=1 Tax=Secundilactobacillus paracollinoides TaxID=240427 RepID=UPI0034E461E4